MRSDQLIPCLDDFATRHSVFIRILSAFIRVHLRFILSLFFPCFIRGRFLRVHSSAARAAAAGPTPACSGSAAARAPDRRLAEAAADSQAPDSRWTGTRALPDQAAVG